MCPGASSQFLESPQGGSRCFVGTSVRDDVKGIDDGQRTCNRIDIGSGFVVRIAGAVPMLVVVLNDAGHVLEERNQVQ